MKRLIALLITLAPLSSHAGSSEIEGFHLATCGPKIESACLKVDAKSAQGSLFRKIFSLSDVHVTMLNTHKAPVKSWEAKSGYFDTEMQRVVLFDKKGEGFSERVISLNDLLGSAQN